MLGVQWRTGSDPRSRSIPLITKNWTTGGAVQTLPGSRVSVTKDGAKAAEWYKKAAAQNYHRAGYLLGILYEYGATGLKVDYPAALKWYQSAANAGDLDAQSAIGNLYANGRGIDLDYGEARLRWLKCAEQGHADSQSALGNLYHDGKGVKKNAEKAADWYRMLDPRFGRDIAAFLNR